MIDLDDNEKINALHGGNKVIQSVNSFSNQLEESFLETIGLSLSGDYQLIENLVVCGMGGSRFPAIIIQSLFKEQLKLPYLINDNYLLPGFVNEKTLVVLSSYSGTTEEVLICGEKALEKKAKIFGITVGGELKLFLEKNNLPHYIINPKSNPSAQPRIGFGYFIGGHLGLLFNLGLINDNQETVTSAIKNLPGLITNFGLEVKKESNPIKKLAQQIFQKYPYYIVSEFLTGVGNAIANQTNETAKSISDFRIIPELNHHLMEGLKFPNKLKEILTFIFFYSNLYSPKIQKRFLITKEVVEKNNIQTIWHELRGKNKVEQAFELMALGSYLSIYLSALYEQNPSVIPYVDYFKKRLKE